MTAPRRNFIDQFWRDKNGIVHVVGLHTDTRVRTECGMEMLRASMREQYYETVDHHITCVECMDSWLTT